MFAITAGTNAQFLRERAAADRCKDYDWTSNGCSVPRWAVVVGWIALFVPGAVLSTAKRRFKHACEQHDFGYANYGPQGKGWLPNEGMRKLIDDVFHRNMRETCFSLNLGPVQQAVCLGTANRFYQAVRNKGLAYW